MIHNILINIKNRWAFRHFHKGSYVMANPIYKWDGKDKETLKTLESIAPTYVIMIASFENIFRIRSINYSYSEPMARLIWLNKNLEEKFRSNDIFVELKYLVKVKGDER